MRTDALLEQRRSASIRLYGLDAAADPTIRLHLGGLDEIVGQTRDALGVCGAGVNLLVDDELISLASTGPLPAPVRRTESICSTVVTAAESADLLEIPDLLADARFATLPFVDGREAALRFYASALLRGKHGVTLGTLCVWDAVPQTLDARRQALLRTFRRAVMNVLDERRRSLVPDTRGSLRTAPLTVRSGVASARSGSPASPAR